MDIKLAMMIFIADGCLIAQRNSYNRKDLGYNSYNVTIQVTDTSSTDPSADTLARTSTVSVILVVQSTDDNPPKDGTKTVTVYNYYLSNGGFSRIPIGNVYVDDPDDWDLPMKKFTLLPGSDPFIM